MNDTREQRIAVAKARMVELAARFVERTRGDLRLMRAGLAKAQAGDAGSLTEIRQLAHRMAGTGATLGFEELGERAAAIEAAIDALKTGASPDTAVLEKLAAEIGALEKRLATDAARA